MQADRFIHGKYVNWVKTSLSLLYLREGITNFCDEKAGQFHQEVNEHVRSNDARASTAKCTKCISKSAFKTKTQDKKNSTWCMHCLSGVCNIWLEEILPYHCHFPLPNIAWENSDPQLWPSDAWEVAKLFQPYGCEMHRRAKDTDCTALLTMMLDCTFFHKYISDLALLQEIKDHRNACMHSGDLEIEDVDMKAALGKMVALLEEPALQKRPESVDAREKIKQLRDNALYMSLNKELELQALNHRVAEVGTDVDRLAVEHRRLHTDLASITTRQDSTVEEYNKLRERVVDVDHQIIEMKNNIESLKHGQDDTALNNKMEDLTSRLQELSSRSQKDVKDLKATMAMFEARLQDLETRKEEEQANNTKCVDVNHVQAHLIDLYEKHCQRVPIYPLRPDWTKRLEDLYVKPHMIVEDPRGRQTQARGCNIGQDTQKEVTKTDDIFYSNDKPCKNIIINGEMGTGKTSLCEHLVALWVRGQTDPKPLPEEESVMSNFKFLFYISLREANRNFKSCYRVESIIASQLQLTECEVAQLMSSYECLVVMDGLDELSKRPESNVRRFGSAQLPERPLRDKSVYVTTSRPFKLELLSRDLEGQIDRQVDIKGLKKSSQRDLAENIVTLLNTETGKIKTAYDFLQDMQTKNMTKHLKTPVLLTMLLGLWYDEVPVWDSQCSIFSSMIERQLMYTEKVQRLAEDDKQQYTYAKETYPNCFMNKTCCQKYISVLMKVAKLAYERLFDTNKENSLVFDHDQTEICGICEAELKQLLQMGILTQQKVKGGVTEELKSISFLHKSHQEFFCAVYLSTNGDKSTLSRFFSEVVRDLEMALELEQVFMFICGMNTEVAAEFSDSLMEIVAASTPIIEYRQCQEECLNQPFPIYSRLPSLIYQIQTFVVAGAVEARKNNKQSENLRLNDILLKKYAIHTAEEIFSCDTTCAKSICIDVILNRRSVKSLKYEVNSWSSSPCLEKVVLSRNSLLKCAVFKDRFSAGQLVILDMYCVHLSLCQLHCLCKQLSVVENLKIVKMVHLFCYPGIIIEEARNIRLDLSRNKRIEIVEVAHFIPRKMLPLELVYICFSQDMTNLKSFRMVGVIISALSLRTIIYTLPLNGLEVNLDDVSVRSVKDATGVLDKMRQCSDFNMLKDETRCFIRDDVCCLFVKFYKGERHTLNKNN